MTRRMATCGLAAAALIVAGGCAHKPDPAVVERQKESAAVDSAKQAFSEELAQGKLAWYVTGTAAPAGFDRQTGLPTRLIPGGADPVQAAYARSHNDAILQYMQQYGPPPGSLRQWEPQILNQQAYFEQQARQQPPQLLKLGGPPVRSPGGDYTLVLQNGAASASARGAAGRAPGILVFTADAESHVPLPAGVSDASADVLFGPAGSNLAFTRWPAGSPTIYAALDLRSGHWLLVQPAAATGG